MPYNKHQQRARQQAGGGGAKTSSSTRTNQSRKPPPGAAATGKEGSKGTQQVHNKQMGSDDEDDDVAKKDEPTVTLVDNTEQNDDDETTSSQHEEHIITTRSITKNGAVNKLSSRFLRDSDEAVHARKLDATRPLLTPRIPIRGHVYAHMSFPLRPDWSDVTSAEELEQKEHEYFQKWLDNTYAELRIEDVSPFEHNLEVWRQLWRVLEKSDVILLLADIRNPLLHIPLALHEYVTKRLGLPMVIVLTKCDLVHETFASSWLTFLNHIFASSSRTTKIILNSGKCIFTHGQGGYSSRRKALHGRATKAHIAELASRAKAVLHTVMELVQEGQDDDSAKRVPQIGVIGQPNTGKSSLVNAIMGRHAVSVSRTCGHTKHWQTLNIRDAADTTTLATLIDSPGIIFPTRVVNFGPGMKESARALYECFGLYPIAQIREVFSAVRFIAERIDVPVFYNLTLDVDDYGEEWTPYAICGALADKRGYTLQRGGGAPDMHRAGLEIIYDTADGILLLAFPPPTIEEWHQQMDVLRSNG